jgi:hypothetical protein
MLNEDPILGDVEELPQKTDTIVYVKNPRRRDGKDLPYLEADVNLAAWPVSRLSFFEIIPGSEEEEIISFVRE